MLAPRPRVVRESGSEWSLRFIIFYLRPPLISALANPAKIDPDLRHLHLSDRRARPSEHRSKASQEAQGSLRRAVWSPSPSPVPGYSILNPCGLVSLATNRLNCAIIVLSPVCIVFCGIVPRSFHSASAALASGDAPRRICRRPSAARSPSRESPPDRKTITSQLANSYTRSTLGSWHISCAMVSRADSALST